MSFTPIDSNSTIHRIITSGFSMISTIPLFPPLFSHPTKLVHIKIIISSASSRKGQVRCEVGESKEKQ